MQKSGDNNLVVDIETKSQVSEISIISRSTNGRFEAKYKVGDKTKSGAFIK